MSVKSYKYFAAAAALVVASASAAIVPVVDQSQTSAPMFIGQFSQRGLTQSFTSATTNVSGGGAYIYYPVTTPFTIIFSVWNALPDRVGAGEIATGSTVVTIGETWADAFWQPVATTVGTTYFLTFKSSSSDNGIGGTLTDSYAGGHTYANASYDSYPSFDYAFRTYTTPGATNVVVFQPSASIVPEPAAWSLMIVGFVLTGAARRRRGTVNFA